MTLQFKSYNYNLIKKFLIQIVWPLITYLNLFCKKPTSLPLDKVRFTIKKAYHVNSKSNEHYEIKTYKVLIKLPLTKNKKKNLKKFYKFLVTNLKTGLSLKIVKNF